MKNMSTKPNSVKELIIISMLIIICYLGYSKFAKTGPKLHKSQISGVVLPDFSLPTLGNGSLQHTDLLGKTYFINFFATWCKICLQEHQQLVTLTQELNMPLYGVAIRDYEGNLNKLLGVYGNPYINVARDEGNFSRSIRIAGLPTIILVNASGKILTSHSGVLDKDAFMKKFQPYLDGGH